MAWIKIPKEHHALFYERLPRDKRIQTLQMFGAAAAKVNGHLFGGLFARSFIVKLDDAAHAEAMALDGAERFDPMGNGRVMSSMVLMPESLMDEPDEMRAWLQRAFDHVASLPPKPAKGSAKSPASKSAAAAKPSKSATPSKAAKPSKSATPSKASAASTAAKPSKPSTAAKPSKPSTAAKPSMPSKTAKPSTASKAAGARRKTPATRRAVSTRTSSRRPKR